MHTTSTIDSNMAVFKAAMKTGTRIMAMVIILILYKLAFNLANTRKKLSYLNFFFKGTLY